MAKLNGYSFSIETVEVLLSSFKKGSIDSRSLQLSVSYLMEFGKDWFWFPSADHAALYLCNSNLKSVLEDNSELAITWFENE